MSGLRMTFLVCDGCDEFWCDHHAPGPISEQRRDARRDGWETRPNSKSDLCNVCLAEGPRDGEMREATVMYS